jgi:hypothetical protein
MLAEARAELEEAAHGAEAGAAEAAEGTTQQSSGRSVRPHSSRT